ncbi:MAG: hypothetical protein CL844_10130 [Crocinitomicaceae bacterium]|nr:hypothetical protein [Crocinitomicaceae bacterium]
MKLNLFLLLISYSICYGQERAEINQKISSKDSYLSLRVDSLDQEIIRLYSKTNSCYLPLLKDPKLYPLGGRSGFEWSDLFNDLLAKESNYNNRYLVGDFMSLDENFETRGIEEINAELKNLVDFKKYDEKLFKLFDLGGKSSNDIEILYSYIRLNYPEDSSKLFNFYDKVWRFKTPPFIRKFSRMRNTFYASGQRVCLCEAYEDTLFLIAQYATSSKRLEPIIKKDSSGEVKSITYNEYLPINKRRHYYAPQYRITSKNWESDRKYEKADLLHDYDLGGGNKHITYYKGRSELPNFLLMKPSEDYPKAMTSNGIHEVALRELSRGMLGTANSIGCIRLSDFGSKFTRWWVPKNAKFFILYYEDRYHKKLSLESIKNELPFKNKEEGDLFRLWLNKNKPLKAKQMDLDIEGSFDNGFILDAYNLFGAEYERHKINLIK